MTLNHLFIFFWHSPWGNLCPHQISTQLDKRLNRWPLTLDDLESIFYAFPFMQALSPPNLGAIGQTSKCSLKPLPRWPPDSNIFLTSVYMFPLMKALSPSNFGPIGQTLKISTVADLWPRMTLNQIFTLFPSRKLRPRRIFGHTSKFSQKRLPP